MSEEQKLLNPPIVEAIIDLDCDMPPDFTIESQIEKAQEVFKEDYPGLKKRYLHSGEIEGQIGEQSEFRLAKASVNVQALLLHHSKESEKQLIQIRQNGFSFNRLAPYTSLDEYFSEIERTWSMFVESFSPILVRRIGLRYINRMLLPLENGRLDLDAYLKVGPRLPQGSRLSFAGFVHQQHLVDSNTGNNANIVLTTQPVEKDKLPLIFDIGTSKEVDIEPSDWKQVESEVRALRTLKNHIFFDSLTEKCTCLFNLQQ